MTPDDDKIRTYMTLIDRNERVTHQGLCAGFVPSEMPNDFKLLKVI